MGDDHSEKASRYRLRAKQIRAVAHLVPEKKARAVLLAAASDYERNADVHDNLARQLRREDTE